MKILFSINQKFYGKSAQYLIEYIKKYDTNNIIKGFEVVFDIENEFETQYIYELAHLCKKYNYILQFHGNCEYSINIQKKYIDFLNEIGKILNYKVNVVIHPQSAETIDESIEKSNYYFSEILNYIYDNNYNLEISIENLNSLINELRPSKDTLTPILANNIDLNFTYDVGHEIIEYGKVTDLNDILLQRITNVHFHTFKNEFDHQPVTKESLHKDKWIKTVQYLKLIHFKNTFVLEYDFNELGSNYDEKLFNYIKCAEFINQYI